VKLFSLTQTYNTFAKGLNHGKQSPKVLQEYPVSVVLCKLLYRLVGEFGMTGSAEEGGKKKTQKEKIMFLLKRN
jgi:hypothetical protein